jgi:hypothetical protein
MRLSGNQENEAMKEYIDSEALLEREPLSAPRVQEEYSFGYSVSANKTACRF